MRISRKAQWIFFIVLNVSIVAVALFSPIYLYYTLEAPLADVGECSSLVLFGLYCPLCGATHAVKHLYELDFIRSMDMNAMILPTILLVLAYDAALVVGLIRGGDRKPLIRWWMIAAYVGVFTLYTVVRNVVLLYGIDPTGFIEDTSYARLCEMFPYWLEYMAKILGSAP